MKKKRRLMAVISLILAAVSLWSLQIFSRADEAEATVYEKLAQNEDIRYMIIGDSIGRGSGAEKKELTWFAQLEELLKAKFHNDYKRVSVVQSGATAFEGIYKLQHTEHQGSIDLIFLVFGENDRKYMTEQDFSYFYEMLLRKAKTNYPASEIITITESPLDNELFTNEIERISDHYHAKNVNMRDVFKKSGLADEQLTKDLIHPNGIGYKFYAEELFTVISSLTEANPAIASLVSPIHDAADFSMDRKSYARKMEGDFRYQNGFLKSSAKGSFLEYEFKGTFVGVNVLRSNEGGMLDVFIDGQYYTTLSTWWPFERKRALYAASGLPDGPHTIRFVVKGEQSLQSLLTYSSVSISSIIVPEKQ
ncbi:SGNH/GDSL hydrolase family protein [Bacillus sp. UMB0728]|uniref:SGNH/GDSL hydrolase family protein n=1 Tax=Bacillus sp. UMB0728 TaxID=2066052 RepID=UPI00215376F3|nr:SGNH/GDSL hydrolase family protein [Bacillus sp. UMB0728]